MIRSILLRVALFDCPGDAFSDRAAPGAIGILPRQAVVFSWRADDLWAY